MNSKQDEIICCSFCQYSAPTVFDLEVHFKYNHSEIFNKAAEHQQVTAISETQDDFFRAKSPQKESISNEAEFSVRSTRRKRRDPFKLVSITATENETKQSANESALRSSKKRRADSASSLNDPLASLEQDYESISESITANATRSSRRKRTIIDDNLRVVLMKMYAQTKLPDLDTRKEISIATGLEPRRVQIWFQNMRMNEKRNGAYQGRPYKSKGIHNLRNRNGRRTTRNKTEIKDNASIPNLSIGDSDESYSKATQQSENTSSGSVMLIDLSIEESAAKTFVADPEEKLLIDFKHPTARLRRNLASPLITGKKTLSTRKCAEEMRTPLEKYDLMSKHSEEVDWLISETNLPDEAENIKIEYSEVAKLKEQISKAHIFSKNTDLARVVSQLKYQINDLEVKQGKLVSKNTDLKVKLSKVEEKASNDMKSLLSDITTLESEVAQLNKQHTNDVKTIDEAKDAINNMSDKLKSKNAELSLAKLSHERSLLELNKHRSSIQNQELNNTLADHFKHIRRTLKLILKNDSKFCKIGQDEELSDSDVLEYTNSILLEFKDVKQRHFVDVRNCISQFEKFQTKKDKYKKRKLKLKKENEDLKRSCEEKDTILSEKKIKFKRLKQQLKDKIKRQEEVKNQKEVKKLEKQVEEKKQEVNDMVANQITFEKQIETQDKEIEFLLKTVQKLEKEKEIKMEKLDKNKLVHKNTVEIERKIAAKDKIIDLLVLKNANLTKEQKQCETRLKNAEIQRDNLKGISSNEELILTLEKSILMMEERIAIQSKTNKSSTTEVPESNKKCNQKKLNFVAQLQKTHQQPIKTEIIDLNVHQKRSHKKFGRTTKLDNQISKRKVDKILKY